MAAEKMDLVLEDEPAPTSEEMIDAVYRFAAEQLEQGKSPAAVADLLMHKGLSADDADDVVAQLREARSRAARSAGKRNMLFGGLWLFGGLAVTLGTMFMADGGGKFMVAWGAVLFGGIQFVRGLFQAVTE